jgi:hypothetical protein
MTRLVVSILGVIAGLAGIEHGIGELLQGNTAPGGIMLQSWPASELMKNFSGEPAMSVIPNFLVSGILSVLISLIFITWAVIFINRKHGGSIMMLISVVLLLVGGGFGPPLLGIILGAAGTRVDKPLSWWRAHLPQGVRRFLSAVSPWVLAACIIAWLLMIPGPFVVGRLFQAGDTENLALALYFVLAAFGLLPAAIIAGFARDIEKPTFGASRGKG